MQTSINRWEPGRWSAVSPRQTTECAEIRRACTDAEQVLLSHVEVCYRMAFHMTGSNAKARTLTRDVMKWAWRELDDEEIMQLDIKRKLMMHLRELYSRRYAKRPSTTPQKTRSRKEKAVVEGAKPCEPEKTPNETLKTTNDSKPRYALEVRGVCMHAEANELFELLRSLDGVIGKAHVIDRQTRELLFEGSASEVCEAIAKNRWSV